MSFLVPLRPLHPNKVHEMASVGLMSVPNPNLCEKNSNLTWSYVIWLAGLTSCPSRMSLRYQSSQATSVSRATVFGRCRDVSELEPLCGDRPFRKSANTQCFVWAYLKIVASNSLVCSSSPTKCLSGTLGAPKFWEPERVIGRRIQKALTSPKTIKAKKHGHTEYMISYNTKAGMDWYWYKLMNSKCNFGWQSGITFTQAQPKCPKTRWASLVAHCSNLFSSLLRYLCEFRKTNSFRWKNFEERWHYLIWCAITTFANMSCLFLLHTFIFIHLHVVSTNATNRSQSRSCPSCPQNLLGSLHVSHFQCHGVDGVDGFEPCGCRQCGPHHLHRLIHELLVDNVSYVPGQHIGGGSLQGVNLV